LLLQHTTSGNATAAEAWVDELVATYTTQQQQPVVVHEVRATSTARINAKQVLLPVEVGHALMPGAAPGATKAVPVSVLDGDVAVSEFELSRVE
jgi:hypothetical protein